MTKEVCSVTLQRWEVIESLAEEAKDKRTLVEDLDCSRSTVNRAIRELESMGVVEYADGVYVVTPLGETIVSRFKEMMQTVELRVQLEPFLKWIPEDEFDLDLKHLQDAKLLLPEPGDPWAMVNRHVSVLEQAEEIRCVLPLTGLHAHQAVYEQVMDNDAWVELVVSPDVAETLQSAPDYAELTEVMATTGRYNIYQFEGNIPYFVGTLENTVQIGVDEDGEPRALIETDNTVVRSWAENKFEEFKRQADHVAITSESTRAQS